MNKSTTDTPRTDAKIWDVVYHHKDEIVVDADFARELERELAETKAEVEFWKAKAHEAEFYEGKHEAEVERLKAKLSRTIEIADEFWKNQKQAVLVYHQELADELDQIKERICGD